MSRRKKQEKKVKCLNCGIVLKDNGMVRCPNCKSEDLAREEGRGILAGLPASEISFVLGQASRKEVDVKRG